MTGDELSNEPQRDRGIASAPASVKTSLGLLICAQWFMNLACDHTSLQVSCFYSLQVVMTTYSLKYIEAALSTVFLATSIISINTPVERQQHTMPQPERVRYRTLQARINELLEQMATTPQPSTSAHPRASLLGMPAEIRTAIFELVVFHAESDGVIAPTPDTLEEDSMTFIAGERMMIGKYKQYKRPVPFLSSRGNPDQDPEKAYDAELKRYKDLFNKSTNRRCNHLCTLDCLAQPGLTIVNRQLREETLPIFYNINRFHFEMSNFTRPGHWKPDSRSPIDWWPAAGDTNLRSIRSMTLISGHERSGLTLRCDRKNVTVESNETAEVWDTVLQKIVAAGSDRETKLLPLVACIKENGLHVRVLERILAVFEKPKVHQFHLRDYSALE